MERIKWKDTPLVSKILFIIGLALVWAGIIFEFISIINDYNLGFIITGAVFTVVGCLVTIVAVIETRRTITREEREAIEQASIPIHEHRLNDDNTLNDDDQFNDPYGY